MAAAEEPQQQQQQRAPSTEPANHLASQQPLLHHGQQQQDSGEAGAGGPLDSHDPLQDEGPYPHPVGDGGQPHDDVSFGDEEGAHHHGHVLDAHMTAHLGDDGSGQPSEHDLLDPSLAPNGGDPDQEQDGNLQGHGPGGAQLGSVGVIGGGGLAAPKTRKRKAKDGEETRPVKASLTAGDWMRVFEFLDEHPELSQLKTVQHFRALPQDALNFNQATLSRTLRKRDQITKLYQSGPQGPQLKRQRKVKYPEVENALLAWIDERKAAGDMPGGKEIKQKVISLQQDLGMDPNDGGLKGTNGWLESFIHTHNLSLPPTASSEAKRAKKVLIANKNKQKAGDGGSPGLGTSTEPSPHPVSNGLGQQSLDSANSHLVMDSYLESDMGGPSSYGLHHGHEAQLATEGMMADVEGFVLGLGTQEQHELQQPSGDGNQATNGNGHQASTGSSADPQTNIDPSFDTNPVAATYPELSIPTGQHGPSSGSGTQRQHPSSAPSSNKFESWLSQVESLERLLETDRADFSTSFEQGQADSYEPAETAADLLKALGRLRTYLAVHHQHH